MTDPCHSYLFAEKPVAQKSTVQQVVDMVYIAANDRTLVQINPMKLEPVDFQLNDRLQGQME